MRSWSHGWETRKEDEATRISLVNRLEERYIVELGRELSEYLVGREVVVGLHLAE